MADQLPMFEGDAAEGSAGKGDEGRGKDLRTVELTTREVSWGARDRAARPPQPVSNDADGQ
jgi:hypothetical protein